MAGRVGGMIWAVMLATACAAGADESAPGERATVVFVDRIINWGSVPITKVRVALLCAPETPAQTIDALTLEPRPARIESDRWGQRVATFRREELAPGKQFVVRSVTDVTLRPWEVDLSAGAADPAAGVPENIKALYLANGEKYALNSERVRQAAAEVRAAAGGGETPDPLAIIEAAFDYVVDHISYSRDGAWDSADKVLERGMGSCSEYTFAFIALCRANGVPARYAGGNARRANATLHIDRISHRWAEAYVPGIGWAPFDATRSDGKDRYRRYFGRWPGDVLALALGDGGPDSAVKWRYESYHQWSGPGERIGVHRRGWWFTPAPDDIRERVKALAGSISHARSAKARRGLIAKARTLGHPLVLPWLENFLYDPQVRVEAAEAVRDIGGPPAVLPLIDCLDRAGDAAGDAAIGALLDEWTGEQIGANRVGWQAWLNTKAFSTFTAPGVAGKEK
jgi:transglutaminase-like putative cysteine protease